MKWSNAERTPEGHLKVTWGETYKRYDRGYEEEACFELGSLLVNPSTGTIEISTDDPHYSGTIPAGMARTLAIAILGLLP